MKPEPQFYILAGPRALYALVEGTFAEAEEQCDRLDSQEPDERPDGGWMTYRACDTREEAEAALRDLTAPDALWNPESAAVYQAAATLGR